MKKATYSSWSDWRLLFLCLKFWMILITVTIMLITVTTIPMISSAIKRDSSIHVFPVCTTSKKYRKFQFIIGWEPTAIRLIMLFVDLFIAQIIRTYNRFSHIFNKKKIYTPKVVVKAVEKPEEVVNAIVSACNRCTCCRTDLLL